MARCLHDYSRRHQHAFVALNCGGLPENLFDSEIFGHEAHAFTGANKRRIGKIEHANGGTLFLDEIESMPVNLQIKLLRVLQEHTLERLGSNQSIPVDCRVIAATKADLAAMGKSGQFRSDLYYRLNVVSLELPALRDRREDILLLVEHADDRLGHRHHVVGGAVVERDHFGARGGRGAENDCRQQRGEQGGAQQGHRRKLRRSGSERLVSQACSKRAWS